MRAPSTAARKQLTRAALPLGIFLSALLVYQSSHAAFTATTTNPGNAWSTGSVVLSDSQGGSSSGNTGTAMFSVTGLKPGVTQTRCIDVTYSGSLAATVRLYASSVTSTANGSVGPYLNFKVEERQGTCAALGTIDATFDAVLAGAAGSFATAHTGHGNGFGVFAPTGASSQARAYVFTTSVKDDDAAQNKDITVTLAWEAQNS